MANNLPNDHLGFDIGHIAHEIDHLFGYSSEWEVADDGEGCSEKDGNIRIDLKQIDELARNVQALGPDFGHIIRFVLAHEKAHHDQELKRTYEKSAEEDPRPYEMDADMVAGWVCANARIPNSFRFPALASHFNDLEVKDGNRPEYPWPQERDLALVHGSRRWAIGQFSEYHGQAQKLGIPDETLHEFLAEVPAMVRALWSRPIPKPDDQIARFIPGLAPTNPLVERVTAS